MARFVKFVILMDDDTKSLIYVNPDSVRSFRPVTTEKYNTILFYNNHDTARLLDDVESVSKSLFSNWLHDFLALSDAKYSTDG